MTLQERMVAVYLRQAKLPPEEKDKLRLFLGLLLTTLEEEEPWEKELRTAPEALAIRFEGEGTAVRSLDCARDDRAEQSRAEQSRAPAPEMTATTFSKEAEAVADPLAGALIEALDRLGMRFAGEPVKADEDCSLEEMTRNAARMAMEKKEAETGESGT